MHRATSSRRSPFLWSFFFAIYGSWSGVPYLESRTLAVATREAAGGWPPAVPPYDLNIRSSFVSGSYILSTTRSLRGMIALSVMVISSGQTLVQHLVMLQ